MPAERNPAIPVRPLRALWTPSISRTVLIALMFWCCGTLLFAADSLAPPEIQKQLDRRAELLQQFMKSDDETRRLQLAQTVSTIEQSLLQQSLPEHNRRQLLDEHNGLLTWLTEKYDLVEPATVVKLWQHVIPVRTEYFGAEHWQVKSARAELHRAQLVAGLGIEERQLLADAEAYSQEGDRAFQEGDLQTAQEYHEKVARVQLTVLGRSSLTSALALRALGRTMLDRERVEPALQVLTEATAIAEQSVGPHPVLIGAMGDLAAATHMSGDTAAAAQLQNRVARMARDVLGPGDPQYATAINNLSLYVAETGDVRQALQLAEEAQRIFAAQKDAGEALADNWNLIGNYAMRLRRYERALTAFEKAIELQRQALGENHFHVAVAHGNAAMAAVSLKQLPSAEAHLHQALKIMSESLGRDHPRLAEPLLQLANLRRAQGRTREVEPLVRQACELIAQRAGERHPAYALAINQWAVLLAEQGKYQQAEELLLQAIDVQETNLGPNSSALAASLTNLAQVQAAMNNRELAKQALQVAGKVAMSALEEKHPKQADQLRQAARIYRDINDKGMARTAMTEAVGLLGKELGEDNPEFAKALTELGSVLIESDEQDRGAALFRKGQELLITQLGESHPDVLETIVEAARLRRALGNPQAAVQELLRYEGTIREQFGPDHDVYADLLLEMGRSMLLTGEMPQAQQRLELAAKVYTAQFGDSSPRTREALQLIELARRSPSGAITQVALSQIEEQATSLATAKQAGLTDRQREITQRLARLAQ